MKNIHDQTFEIYSHCKKGQFFLLFFIQFYKIEPKLSSRMSKKWTANHRSQRRSFVKHLLMCTGSGMCKSGSAVVFLSCSTISFIDQISTRKLKSSIQCNTNSNILFPACTHYLTFYLINDPQNIFIKNLRCCICRCFSIITAQYFIYEPAFPKLWR